MLKKAKSNEMPEFLQVAAQVALEQGIDKEAVLCALESALAKPALMKYGEAHDIRVHIDRETGAMRFLRYQTVVASVLDVYKEIGLEEARTKDAHVNVGDVVTEELPPIEFDRIEAQLSRQIIGDKLRETRRAIQYEEYKDRIGELITVMVKRHEISYVLAEFGNKAEGIIRKDNLLPREKLQVGERIQAVISEIRPEAGGPIIYMSRTNNQFLKALLAKEINEIYEGLIDVKSIARDPGSRAKIAVYTADPAIDAVGACVGIRGSRIQAVSAELSGEKIDVVHWSPDPATYIINALAPAAIAKVILDEENDRIEVVVLEDQLSLAIGRRGQNVKLASALTGWEISILTEHKESERYAQDLNKNCTLFMHALDVDEMIGRLLAVEGYNSVEQLAEDSLSELEAILDSEIAIELQKRARDYLQSEQTKLVDELKVVGASDDFISYKALTTAQKRLLAASDVKTLENIADLSSDELLDILGEARLSMEEASRVIMDLRARYYDIH